MTPIERTEAEVLLRKYDIKTIAPLAVSCGLIRILREHEEAQRKLHHKDQMSFDWIKDSA